MSVHGEVNVLNAVKVVSKLNFFSILMDGSTNNGKEKEKDKEGVYIQLFQRE